MSDLRRQELYCHDCGRYVQFDVDLSLDGNHILSCPNCSHEHCRVVKDGEITDIRWDSRNPTYVVTSTSYSYVSNYDTCTSSTVHLYQAWMNATS